MLIQSAWTQSAWTQSAWTQSAWTQSAWTQSACTQSAWTQGERVGNCWRGKRWWVMLAIGVLNLALLMPMAPAIAAIYSPRGDLSHQPVIEVPVSLGNTEGELKFIPNTLQFSVGKRYKLLLTNPSEQKHYFTAKDFADGIWTQKVDTGLVEIKGAIHEVEIRPHGQAEWVFVPIRPGHYSLRCTVAGHTEAGMVGDLEIGVKG
jgi:uncharacterized cupredoxin-like copper-binding protein